ncbi:DUF2785 domain-containing protein [Oceanirhabdus sp. W0125-5]|uniref:DUF2785 domain-containing protein n=1 Tax=Oceanirhabdus sp. W0125-5 TaxID=2999116 RepID=UPI0022F333D6|nr:DUF2785 domain-containing protein [Oceanirhabdus sp. W0125-5]WBW96761.1 DUF2785 domain-containing protein [Oceanirhabdus sp. W0125-5]
MYNEREQLRIDLKRIKANDYNLSKGEKASDYLDLMLKFNGDTDSELRDSLILNTFVYWIEDKGYFSSQELIDLLNRIISKDYIFYNIGNENDDSVFKRSFSILLVNPILCVHMNSQFLDRDMILKIKDALIRYLNEEKDLRGYVQEKGWAHTLAHAADGIDILLNCEGINEEVCKEVLLTIENKYLEGKYFLCAEEDERLINIIYFNIIEDKLLSDDYICNWIKGFTKVLEIKDKTTKFKARTNVKNLLRSLYFRMLHLKNNEQISKTILDVEKNLNLYLE